MKGAQGCSQYSVVKNTIHFATRKSANLNVWMNGKRPAEFPAFWEKIRLGKSTQIIWMLFFCTIYLIMCLCITSGYYGLMLFFEKKRFITLLVINFMLLQPGQIFFIAYNIMLIPFESNIKPLLKFDDNIMHHPMLYNLM